MMYLVVGGLGVQCYEKTMKQCKSLSLATTKAVYLK